MRVLERGPGAELQVEVDVAAGAGAAGAELVVAGDLRARRRSAAIAASIRSSSAGGGASSTRTRPEPGQDPDAGDDDRAGDRERRDRVEGGLAGDLDQQQADQHADRGQRVGAQVRGVALERRRVERPRAPVEEGRDAEVGDRRERDHGDPDAEVLDLRADRPAGGSPRR